MNYCHTHYQYIYYANVFCCAVEEPITGKKRKGKDSRPLRIDLILQHDSLVPPPKESVFFTSALHVNMFIYFVVLEKYMDFFSYQWQFMFNEAFI